MTAENFVDALHHDPLINVVNEWEKFVPALKEAWKTFKGKKSV